MKPKIPWLPAEVQAGQKTEICPACGANRMIPWTLTRNAGRTALLRTWVCTACQQTEVREEPDA
jgi:DNA-directed RNA polymerase subunit M/transcription elongation factor TFIIS